MDETPLGGHSLEREVWVDLNPSLLQTRHPGWGTACIIVHKRKLWLGCPLAPSPLPLKLARALLAKQILPGGPIPSIGYTCHMCLKLCSRPS